MLVGVTGCAGFVGSVLCYELLEKGYRVRGLDNIHKGYADSLFGISSHPNFQFMRGDITSEKDLEKFLPGLGGVIHLAAIVGFPNCARNPSLSQLVNVTGSQLLSRLKAKINPDIPMIFSSTGSVYGSIGDRCQEDITPNPISEYGKHKYLAEKVITSYPNNIAYRFSTAFGPSYNMRVNLLVNSLVFEAYTNKVIHIFEKNAKRSFIHVRDMAKSFIFGIENHKSMDHKIYNVGDPDMNYTKEDIANMVAAKTGCLINFADVGKDPDARDYFVDFARINSLGWKCEHSMEEGINDLIKIMPLIEIRHRYE